MNVGDIIEIVTVDNGRINVRRVRIKECERRTRRFDVVARNLRGNFPKHYALPLEPVESTEGLSDGTYWMPFDNSGEIDP